VIPIHKASKTFDCVAFKRAAQAEIYERIRDMTPAEQAAWFEQAASTGPFANLWQRLHSGKPSAQTDSDRPPSSPDRALNEQE
jgi:hypothetical protein